jgi:integrase
MDAGLDTDAPCVHVRRAIVNGQLTAPKSRHGRRTIPISLELADRLRQLVAGRGETELLFRGAQGAALRRAICAIACSYRPRIAWAFLGRAFTRCATPCAAMLIDAGASPLRLQRWMGHHSAAFTLDTYGHLLHDDLGPHLDLGSETDDRSPPATLGDVRRRGTDRA